jgi:hypothetical protein
MERQAGLGRSLEDVLESFTPAETDAAAGRVLFEPEDLEQQLDQLMNDVAALRERVQHLVGLVPEGAVPASMTDTARGEPKKKNKKHKGKSKKDEKKSK